MPKQYESAGGNGILAVSGGLLQQRTDLWAREMPYWQKFMATSRYFDEYGTVTLSSAVPKSSFFRFLHGLTAKEKSLLLAPGKGLEAAGNKKQEASFPMGAVAKHNHILPISGRENPVTAPSYGRGHTLPESVSGRYGQGLAAPMENTAIYQSYVASYLNQQINEYRYLTESVQQNIHLQSTAVVGGDGEKQKQSLRPLPEVNGSSRKGAGAVTAVPMEKPSATGKETTGANSIEAMVTVSNDKNDTAAAWQPMLRETMAPYRAAAENGPDWSELCSLLRQSVAEAFTELLQNMIPETEGR